MALAPVRAAAVGLHDLLDPAEVGLPVELAVLVHGDVADVAGVGGAQDHVVGGGEADLDRVRDPQLRARRQMQHPAHGLGRMLSGDPVLHLGEPDPALRREHRVGAVDLGRAPGAGGGQPGDPGNLPRQVAGGEREGAADPVLEHHLLGVDQRRRPRPRRLVRAAALPAERGLGVREDVELEVVVGGVELVEARQGRVERPRPVDAVERVGGDGADRRRVDDPERAEPDPRGRQPRGVGGSRDLERAAVGEHHLDRIDLGRDAAKTGAGAVGPGGDRAGQGLAVDVAEVLERQAELIELAVQGSEHDPGLDLDQPRLPVDRKYPVERVAAHHHPVGERDVAERVPRPRGAHRLAALPRAADDLDQLLAGSRALDRGRLTPLIPRPVSPPRRHRRERIRQTPKRSRRGGRAVECGGLESR